MYRASILLFSLVFLCPHSNEQVFDTDIDYTNQYIDIPFTDQPGHNNDYYKRKNQQWLDDNGKKSSVTTLPSGLQYRIKIKGSGSIHPGEDDIVGVHYSGKLVSGKEFDSSYSRGHPTKFRVGRYFLRAFDEVPLMRVGDRWEFYVPAHMGFGARGAAGVPPWSVLIFDVSLVEIQGKEELDVWPQKDEL